MSNKSAQQYLRTAFTHSMRTKTYLVTFIYEGCSSYTQVDSTIPRPFQREAIDQFECIFMSQKSECVTFVFDHQVRFAVLQ